MTKKTEELDEYIFALEKQITGIGHTVIILSKAVGRQMIINAALLDLLEGSPFIQGKEAAMLVNALRIPLSGEAS